MRWMWSLPALLLPGFLGAAVLHVEVVGAPPPPSQAAAQGFTTLAFNGDMGLGFDVSCANPATGDHQWYLGGNRTLAASCANLNYPFIDTDGSKVLDIFYGPSSDTGGILGRVGISTADFWGAHQTSFPLNAYYECTMRYNSYSISHMPLWSACWFVNADLNVISGVNPGLGLEFDLTEFHGGYPNNQELGGAINWNCRSTCYGMAWFGNAKSIIPTYDPSEYHTYGWLLYQTTATNLHGKSYIDNILVNEGDIQIDIGGVDEQAQRNYILIHLNAGCNFDEHGNYCMNQPISNVAGNSFGGTTIFLPYPQVWAGSFLMGVTGVQGVTSQINGNFRQNGCDFCTSVEIFDKDTGARIPFSGAYIANTGVINAWNDSNYLEHAYVKSYRVYSCSTWATTQCSAFNPH